MEPTQPLRRQPKPLGRRLPCLVVVRGKEAGRVISIGRGTVVLGRGSEADIRLEDRGVSRRHACFRVREGRVSLEDLGSTNGSWCNGRRVEGVELQDGDQLQLGDCRLAFRLNHPDEGRLLELLYYRATRDPLTGLLNRASLEDRLGREVERQRRYQRGLAVVQLDLDHFKQINDVHGHAAGDQVLKAVARAARSCLRASDLAARTGGEELVLVLPETGLSQAWAIAEKVRARVASLQLARQGKSIPVTASLGVSAAKCSDCTAARLLAAADAACYRAKKGGRNQVCR